MSLSIVSIPANSATVWEDWVTREQAIDKDHNFCSLTNWGSTSIPQIGAGSEIIINNALYRATANDTITDLSGTANSTEVWFVASASGSTATVSAVTADGSSWDADKGGYYDGNDRYIGGCYKDSSGNYINKWIYKGQTITESEIDNPLRKKIFQIGDWDMDSTDSVNITHELPDHTKIRDVQVFIIVDGSSSMSNLERRDVGGGDHAGWYLITATLIELNRTAGGMFDSVSYNATSFNRGWVTVWYEAT